MALAHTKLDKLLTLFSSSEDEELDKICDEDNKDFDDQYKKRYEEIQEDHKVIRETRFSKNKSNREVATIDVKVVELEVKPIMIEDSENDSVHSSSGFKNKKSLKNVRSKRKTRKEKTKKHKIEDEDETNIESDGNKIDIENDLNYDSEDFEDVHKSIDKKTTKKIRPRLDRNLKCKECNKRMENEQLFIFHMQTHEGRREEECVLCNKDFKSLQALLDHYATFDKNKENEHFIKLRPYSCDICGLRYKQRRYLFDHMESHNDNKNYLCQFCGKQFNQPSSLKVHLRYHQKSYHSCERCNIDLKFRNSKEHHAHLRIVHGENTFKCPICDREFSRNYDMLKHKDTHSREPNCCVQCNIHFTFRREYYQHMREVHNRIKKYTCTVCSKVFLMHCLLARHLETHNKILENCYLCGKEFKSRKEYNTHIKNVHGVVLDVQKSEAKQKAPHKVKTKKLNNAQLKESEPNTKDDVKLDIKADFSEYFLNTKNNF